MSTSTTSTTTPNNNNNNNNNSFPQQLRKITKALEEDNDDEYLDYLETFTATYNPLDQKVSQIINKNSQFLIKAKFLELIMSRLLPATFSELFLAVLRILAVIDDYEQEIYAADGVTKILYSMRENMQSDKTQILGCQVIAFLACDEAVREAMGEDGAIEQLIRVIHTYSNSTPTLKAALAAIVNLAFDSSNNKATIVQGTSVGTNSGTNRNGSNWGVIQSAWTKHFNSPGLAPQFSLLLRNIVGESDNHKLLHRQRVIEQLVKYAVTHESESRALVHLLWAIINITAGCDHIKRQFPLDTGVPLLIRCLGRHKVKDDEHARGICHAALIATHQLASLASIRNHIISVGVSSPSVEPNTDTSKSTTDEATFDTNNTMTTTTTTSYSSPAILEVLYMVIGAEAAECLLRHEIELFAIAVRLLERLCVNRTLRYAILANEEKAKFLFVTVLQAMECRSGGAKANDGEGSPRNSPGRRLQVVVSFQHGLIRLLMRFLLIRPAMEADSAQKKQHQGEEVGADGATAWLVLDDETVARVVRGVLKENQAISTLAVTMNSFPESRLLKLRICAVLNAIVGDTGLVLPPRNSHDQSMHDGDDSDDEDNGAANGDPRGAIDRHQSTAKADTVDDDDDDDDDSDGDADDDDPFGDTDSTTDITSGSSPKTNKPEIDDDDDWPEDDSDDEKDPDFDDDPQPPTAPVVTDAATVPATTIPTVEPTGTSPAPIDDDIDDDWPYDKDDDEKDYSQKAASDVLSSSSPSLETHASDISDSDSNSDSDSDSSNDTRDTERAPPLASSLDDTDEEKATTTATATASSTDPSHGRSYDQSDEQLPHEAPAPQVIVKASGEVSTVVVDQAPQPNNAEAPPTTQQDTSRPSNTAATVDIVEAASAEPSSQTMESSLHINATTTPQDSNRLAPETTAGGEESTKATANSSPQLPTKSSSESTMGVPDSSTASSITTTSPATTPGPTASTTATPTKRFNSVIRMVPALSTSSRPVLMRREGSSPSLPSPSRVAGKELTERTNDIKANHSLSAASVSGPAERHRRVLQKRHTLSERPIRGVHSDTASSLPTTNNGNHSGDGEEPQTPATDVDSGSNTAPSSSSSRAGRGPLARSTTISTSTPAKETEANGTGGYFKGALSFWLRLQPSK